MANTYTALHYHFTFSTKLRQPWIRPEIEQRIWEYVGGIARANGLKPLKIGGIEDHIHMLVGAPPTMAPSKIAQLVKGALRRGFMRRSAICVISRGKTAMGRSR